MGSSWQERENDRSHCACSTPGPKDDSIPLPLTIYPSTFDALRKKPLGYKLGTLRYWQIQGQGYAEMFKGSLTAGGIVTAGAAWLGVGKAGAILLGIGSVFFWQVLAMVLGWLAWKYHVVQSAQKNDGINNPIIAEQLALLRRIADSLSTESCPLCDANVLADPATHFQRHSVGQRTK